MVAENRQAEMFVIAQELLRRVLCRRRERVSALMKVSDDHEYNAGWYRGYSAPAVGIYAGSRGGFYI